MKWLIFLFFLFANITASAADTAWLDQKWQSCKKERAHYYSISTKNKDLWLQQMYYSGNGHLFMIGYFNDAACTMMCGIFKWYTPTGEIIDSIIYQNNQIRYLCHFHPNGKVKTILIYNDKNLATYVNSWNMEGHESYSDTFYHDRHHRECNKDTAYLKGIITKEDNAWHLRFYFQDNGGIYINSYYKERLCTTRIKSFECYKNGKLLDSALYNDYGKRVALWQYHNNCMLSSYRTFDTSGHVTSGKSWDEGGNETVLDTSVVYPSQPGGFKRWKKAVMLQINNDKTIDRIILQGYYGSVQVKLYIDKKGQLLTAFIPHPSAFPDMDALILKTCKSYQTWKPGTRHGRKADFLLNCNFFFTAGLVTGYQQTY